MPPTALLARHPTIAVDCWPAMRDRVATLPFVKQANESGNVAERIVPNKSTSCGTSCIAEETIIGLSATLKLHVKPLPC